MRVSELNKQIDLVFIVGSGRCGTTLLKNILNRHPDIAVVPEMQFFKFVFGKRKKYKNLNNRKTKGIVVKKTIDLILDIRIPQDQLTAINYDDFYHYLLPARSYKEIFLRASFYTASKKQFKILVHKSPSDIYFLKEVFSFFPQAKIIHLIRDGREVVASARKRGWSKNNILLAVQWKEALACGRKFRKKYKNKILECKYEDIVSRPESEIKKILSFIGAREPNKEFFDFSDFSYNNTSFADKRKPGGISLSRNFTSFFTLKEQAELEFLLASDLRRQGYKIKGADSLSFKDKIRLKLLYVKEKLKFKLFILFAQMGYSHIYYKLKRALNTFYDRGDKKHI